MPEIIGKENIAQTVAQQAQKPFTVIERDNVSLIAVPDKFRIEANDFEHLLTSPRRKKAKIKLTDTESFADYVAAHKIDTLTTVYCAADYAEGKVEFLSVINDHAGTPDGQQWRDHTALYKPEKSVEWLRWSESDRKPHNQIEFAVFIEDNLDDIANVDGMPTRSELLQMVLHFEANQDSRLKQHARLQNGGIELNFVSQDDEQTIQKMKMFEKISIGIPVFHGDKDIYRIDARLRYRIREGKLTFWYEMIRPDKVLEAATKQMIDTIKTGTGIPFYFGHPGI